MKQRIVLAGVLVILVVAGCAPAAPAPIAPSIDQGRQIGLPEGQIVAPQGPVAPEVPAPPAVSGVGGAPEATDQAAAAQGFGRFIISQAQMTIYAENPEFTLIQIEDLALALGGFISNSQISRFEDQIQGLISIRVPAQAFKEARRRIRDLAQEVAADQVSGQDVTEEFTDLQSRLRHLEATEAELLELLTTVRERTQSAAEVLAIFNELTKIREQIEQVKGRINYLDNLVTFASITVQVLPPPEPEKVEFIGEVESVEDETFVVNGTTVVLEADAEVIGEIEEGAIVEVRGLRHADGTVSASRVEVAELLAGEVESIEPSFQGRTLVVQGRTVILGPGTEIIGALQEGSQVEIHGFPQEDDSLQAARVKVTKAAPRWNPGRTVRQALAQLTLAIQGIADLAIWVLLFVLPTAVLLSVPVLAAFSGWQWYQRRRRGAAGAVSSDRPMV
ncbi:MAG: DUF4349 domain-containing protein [Chloroflexi bacterium]|nr:DUF4349 domain-containing protein [Chloroflexota bacterium]